MHNYYGVITSTSLAYPIPLVDLLHVSREVSVDETERRVEHIEVDSNPALVTLHGGVQCVNKHNYNNNTNR